MSYYYFYFYFIFFILLNNHKVGGKLLFIFLFIYENGSVSPLDVAEAFLYFVEQSQGWWKIIIIIIIYFYYFYFYFYFYFYL